MLGCTTTPNLPENPDDDKEDLKDSFSEENSLIIARDGQFNYQIVRSDLKGRGTVEQIVSVQLRQALGDMVGASPAIGTDYDGEFEGFSRQECEFLIGKTNREESDTAYAAMGDYEYSITIVGSKICICGVNDRALQCAMDDFLANYLKKTDDGIIYVSREMNVLANSYIAEGTYFEVKAAGGSGAAKYDEALALACLQGIMNRESPARVYVNSGGGNDGVGVTHGNDTCHLINPLQKLRTEQAAVGVDVSRAEDVLLLRHGIRNFFDRSHRIILSFLTL
jgi:hypothetical protein